MNLHAPHFAWFISPHGFGHATRSIAVMQAVQSLRPASRFSVFTHVPGWLFAGALGGDFTYHEVATDIGMVQASPLHEDVAQTAAALDAFLPFAASDVASLADTVRRAGCGVVICDIAPLGIAVAREAGVPSILLENFTWDWIYEPYAASHESIARHRAYLHELFLAADVHIQAEPVCNPRTDADLTTGPISRASREPRAATRARLGIGDDTPLVTITMGGLPAAADQLAQLVDHPAVHFVLPGVGGASGAEEMAPNAHLLPQRSDVFHPDLITASDVVIGKVGYSTLAEVYAAGVPFGYVPRPTFRESAPLVAFIEAHMTGLEIGAAAYASGAWLARLPQLLALPREARRLANGAAAAAEFILGVVDES